MAATSVVSHVIFDIDGLLLDTESIYTEVTSIVLARYGKTFTWEIKSRQMGKKEEDASKIVIDELQLPLTVEEYLKQTWVEQERLFPKTDLLPGVEKLVRHLHKNGIPMGLATGSSEKKYVLKITRHKELFSLFHHVTFSSGNPEVKHSKPAPDVFLVSASKFPEDPDPSKVLVFEDANNGVEGALNAGMQCVWIPDPRADTSQLVDKVTLLRSMEDFRPEQFGLPPYDS